MGLDDGRLLVLRSRLWTVDDTSHAEHGQSSEHQDGCGVPQPLGAAVADLDDVRLSLAHEPTPGPGAPK